LGESNDKKGKKKKEKFVENTVEDVSAILGYCCRLITTRKLA